MRILAILTFCAAPVFAQSAAVPRIGWALGEEPGRIHEVVGIAGAAQLGPPLVLCDAKVLALRPGSNIAIVVRADGSAGLLRLRPGRQDAGWQVLDEAVSHADAAAWSPLGRALVLASAAAGRLQVWRVEEGRLRLAYELPVAAARAAVSDAGTVLAEIDGALSRIGPEGSMAEVSRRAAGPFTFLAGSERYAWLEDSVIRLEGGDDAPAVIDLEGGEDRKRMLFSLAEAPLGIVEAGAEGSLLTVWSGDARRLGQWEIPAAVTQVAAAGPGGVIQLLAPGGPVWMASFDRAGGRVFFVPRSRQEEDDPR